MALICTLDKTWTAQWNSTCESSLDGAWHLANKTKDDQGTFQVEPMSLAVGDMNKHHQTLALFNAKQPKSATSAVAKFTRTMTLEIALSDSGLVIE